MNFDEIITQIMIDNTETTLEKAFCSMLDNLKTIGETMLDQMYSYFDYETRKKILNSAWSKALSKANNNQPPVKLSVEDFLSLVDDEDDKKDDCILHSNKKYSFPMSIEEFLSLTEDELDELDAESLYNTSNDHYTERAEQSILNKYGYSVSQESHKTDKQRQDLLEHLILTRKVSKSYVISYLEHLIKINGKKEANYLAVEKWKSDLNFVRKLK